MYERTTIILVVYQNIILFTKKQINLYQNVNNVFLSVTTVEKIKQTIILTRLQFLIVFKQPNNNWLKPNLLNNVKVLNILKQDTIS